MQKEAILAKARTDFKYFVAFMQPNYQFCKFNLLLCELLNEVAHRRLLRLAVSMPPRHGKSFLCSQLFPAFLYGLYSNHQLILATYGAVLSLEFGGKVRRLMESPEYKLLFDTSILGNSQAAGKFITAGKAGEGNAIFTGRNGTLTGFGADTLILDDTLKSSQEAQSEIILDGLIKWYDSVAASRLMPSGAIIQIGTRWGENDLIGYVLKAEPEKWQYLNLSALAESDDELGREIDKPLWPERFDFEHLDSIRRRNPYYFSSLYQGRPIAKEGNLLRAECLQTYERLPSHTYKQIIISIDSASKALTEHDYTVATIWQIINGVAYLIRLIRERYEMPELLAMVEHLYYEYLPNAILIEDASSGIGLLQFLRKSLPSPEILHAISSSGNALVKLNNVIPMFANRIRLLPRTEATEALYTELLGFPYAEHDDCVTSVRQFVQWYQERTGLHNESELILPSAKTMQALGLTLFIKPRKRSNFEYASIKHGKYT